MLIAAVAYFGPTNHLRFGFSQPHSRSASSRPSLGKRRVTGFVSFMQRPNALTPTMCAGNRMSSCLASLDLPPPVVLGLSSSKPFGGSRRASSTVGQLLILAIPYDLAPFKEIVLLL